MNLSLTAAAEGGGQEKTNKPKNNAPMPPHLHQVVVLQADGQVQRGHEDVVEDIGVGPQVQEAPAALRTVLLHRPVQGRVPLLVAAVQHWPKKKGVKSTPDQLIDNPEVSKVSSVQLHPRSVCECVCKPQGLCLFALRKSRKRPHL